jgi:hypothetical protein
MRSIFFKNRGVKWLSSKRRIHDLIRAKTAHRLGREIRETLPTAQMVVPKKNKPSKTAETKANTAESKKATSTIREPLLT